MSTPVSSDVFTPPARIGGLRLPNWLMRAGCHCRSQSRRYSGVTRGDVSQGFREPLEGQPAAARQRCKR